MSSQPPEPPQGPEGLPEFLIDPDVIVFSGQEEPPIGTVQLHSLGGKISDLFGRSKKDVAKELDSRLDQVRSMLERSAETDSGAFRLSEVTVELGFSAEGAIVFVAKAGVSTTIAVKFSRR